jgi:parvulin-like peptidyl-prolyl isomerase
MHESSTVPVNLDEILSLLKRNLQIKEIVYKILSQKVINQTAQARGITVTAEEVQAEADRQRHEMRLEKASDTLAWLADQMISPDDWEVGICDRLLTEKLAESLFAKEVDQFFAQNKIQFDQVLLYQIIVPTESVAQELFYELEEGEISFYQAAHFYDSDERRRQQCGCEGTVYRWQLKPEIAAAVFNAPPREVISPIQTNVGYHILMVEAFIPAKLTPQRYQEIRDRLFQEWLTSEINYRLHNQT